MRRKNRHSGILSNTYLPPLRPTVAAKELAKLTAESLFNLVELWFTLPVTQPIPSKQQRKRGATAKTLVADFRKVLETLKQGKASPKRKLIDRILVDFYPNGLNTLQLAQMDVQLMVDKPSLYTWVSSTAKIAQGGDYVGTQDALKDFIFSLDSQSFLDHLIKNLANLYLTHIYISRHPQLPLIIIRIQMYEYAHLKRARKNSARKEGASNPDIISRKPYYLAIPTSSPNLIHSVSNEDDLASRLILQAVETTLSSGLHQVKLIRNKEAPLKTLEAIHVLKGVSRFGNALGSWAPYADGSVDICPLERSEEHIVLKPSKAGNLPALKTEKDERRAIAALKFKGSFDGKIKSKRLYETNGNKRRQVNLEDQEELNEYASLVPVQNGEFTIQNKLKKIYNTHGPSSDEAPKVRLRLFGSDIFAGLHEIAVEGVIDPKTVPSWLTGEEGLSYGTIKDGEFIRKDTDTI